MTPEGWRKTCIGGVATVATGGTPRRDDPSLWGGGIPWMSSGEVHKRRVRSTDETISRRALDISNAKLLPANSVVLALNGQGRTRGMSAILEIPATCNQSLAAILPTSLIDPIFLLHSLESKYAAIRAITGDGGRNGLNLALVRSIELVLPPLPEQRKVAAILSSVDDAIEASQAVIDQIQVVKKAMMAELLTKGLPGRHKKFKQTEIGELPEEWDLRLLDEVTTKVTDGEHLSPTLSSKGHPILSAKHIREDQVVFQDYGLVAEEDFLRYRKRCDPMVGDVLIVSRGATIGRVHFLSQSAIPFCLMGSVIQVRPQPAVLDGAFLASFLVLDRSQRELVRASGSSAQQAIYLAHLKKMPVPVPTLGEQEAIAGVHHRFGNRLSAESAFLSSLQALKSALMSVLLTGEVRVRVDKDAAA